MVQWVSERRFAMEQGHLIMSKKERLRFIVLDRVKQGQLSLKHAAIRLEISYRQARRLLKRLRKYGAAGLVHKSRGRPSNRTKPLQFKQKVLKIYKELYDGFGPTLAAEKLEEDHGLVLDHETLRRWLLEAGLWEKQRKRRKHRTWRKPKEHFGEMIQMDGSHHKWFGENGEKACLIVMVDDATKTKLAVMGKEETIVDCMKTLWKWIKLHGIPKTIYADRKNVYVTDREPTLDEQLAGKKPKTVFGIACEKLGIEIIPANSPQAKGRVERTNGIYQDRFVKELKLKGITTIDGANELLSGGFNDSLNRKFTCEPKSNKNYHRPLLKGQNLDEIFCFEHTRTITNDWTIRFENRVFQILKKSRPLPKPRDKVTVRILLDGRMQIVYREKKLRFEDLGPAAKPDYKAQQTTVVSTKTPKTKHVPPADHPWRRDFRRAKKTTGARP